MKTNQKLILKTIVGSQAHNLAGADSDYDYRGVYVIPTTEILTLGFKYKGSDWFEGAEDQTTYEIGHFLKLATCCNPSILEVFKAPIVDLKDNEEDNFDETGFFLGKKGDYGQKLRDLFPYIWNPKDAFNAFVGYGLNQRKKMLDNHLDRWLKYAVAYVRTLHNLCDLLNHGDFSLVVPEGVYRDTILEIKNGNLTIGEIIDYTEKQTQFAKYLLEDYETGKKKQEPNIDKVHEYLFKIRKEFWDFK